MRFQLSFFWLRRGAVALNLEGGMGNFEIPKGMVSYSREDEALTSWLMGLNYLVKTSIKYKIKEKLDFIPTIKFHLNIIIIRTCPTFLH